MHTRKLESFAAAARGMLMAQVGARLSAVLAPASAARVESPAAVRALEARVRERGGGEEGRRHVVEEQAYVWFNRIVALRFMDARGYTGPALVSPDAGRQSGQPAVLAAAKRGELDPQVVSSPGAMERILGLLDGAVPSPDAQGEAYGLILAAYCAHWNAKMPFMFAPGGDYTGLLMPADMLSQASVRAMAVEALTVQDCQDVEVIGWLYQFYISERKNEVFAAFSKGAKAGADEIPAATQLFTPDWIVRYLVQNSVGRLWMLNHPGSRLVEQMEYYVEPVDGGEEVLRIAGPEELTVMDPCCGSGHMLTYAFDLLYAIYDEEGYAPSEIPGLILTHNLWGAEIDPRAAALASFALMMKARSYDRGFLRRREQVLPRICVVEPVEFAAAELDRLAGPGGQGERDFWQAFMHADVLGSLIRPDGEALAEARQRLEALEAGTPEVDTLDAADLRQRAQRVVTQAEYLACTYAVVVTNPPYMGGGNMGAVLKKFVRSKYPAARMDLCTSFIQRCVQLSECDGLSALITQDSWMSVGACAKYRDLLLRSRSILVLAHLGTSAFEGVKGDVVSAVAFVLRRRVSSGGSTFFVRAVEPEGEDKAVLLRRAIAGGANGAVWVRDVEQFLEVPGAPMVYWATSREVAALREGPYLTDVVVAREGLTTGDNFRFLRRWYEVSVGAVGFGISSDAAASISGRRWFPYQKGGSARGWYGSVDYVVDWENDGWRMRQNVESSTGRVRSHNYNGEYGFRAGLTWSGISGDSFSVRHVDGGFMFDAKGPMAFAINNGELLSIEGFLNSAVTTRLMRLLAPRLDFKLGHVLSLPIRPVGMRRVCDVVERRVAIAAQDWNAYETSWDFVGSPLVQRARPGGSLEDALERWWQDSLDAAREAQALETENNRHWARLYDLEEEVPVEVPLNRVSLTSNPWFRYAGTSASSEADLRRLFTADAVKDLISYGVGCVLGRYSLDAPGLILADAGSTLEDYLRRVPEPTFRPDADGIIPVTDGEWFEDDIVTRLRAFLAAAFGPEQVEAGVHHIEEVLGKSLRQYLVKDFYTDHCKRYSNRPIYWMFSSRPETGPAFRALVYLHRYTPSTPSTVLGEYLRTFQAKLRAAITRLEGAGTAADLKRADAHRRALTECEDYERDVLFPLASKGVEINLDDGVLINYLRLGRALQKVASIENKRPAATTWTWPTHPLSSEGGAL